MKKRAKEFLRKLFLINDTPHNIALGAGAGVFWGILPGTGPAVAFFFAMLVRANRLAAVLGAALFNTWTNFVFFPAAVQLGALCFGLNAATVRHEVAGVFKNFHWRDFFAVVMGKYFVALACGYILAALAVAIVIYGMVLYVMVRRQKQGGIKNMKQYGLAIMAVVFLGAASLTFAQGAPGARPAQKTILDYKEDLNLSDAQIVKIKAAAHELAENNRAVFKEESEVNHKIHDLLGSNGDMEELRGRIKGSFALKAQMVINGIETARRIEAVLTPAQLVIWHDLQARAVAKDQAAREKRAEQ